MKRAEDAIKETTDAIALTEGAVKETTNAIARTEGAINQTTEQTQNAIRETTNAIGRTETAMEKTRMAIEQAQAELVQQGQTLTSFTIVTTAFLPLSFCTSVFNLPSLT